MPASGGRQRVVGIGFGGHRIFVSTRYQNDGEIFNEWIALH